MYVIFILLLIGAAVCFGAAAFAKRQPRVNLVALGLLLWVLVPLLQSFLHLTR